MRDEAFADSFCADTLEASRGRVSDLKDTLERLYGRISKGTKLGLERVAAAADKLGNPEKAFAAVHVAGTNGKGSVCAFVAAMLAQNSEEKVGLYTSPHLISVRERMTINGERISEREFTKAMAHVVSTVNMLPVRERKPTYFEIVTATALERLYPIRFGVPPSGL